MNNNTQYDIDKNMQIILDKKNELVFSREKLNNRINSVLNKLRDHNQRIEEVYYSPGFPGYLAALEDFTKLSRS
jgi:hypothetical protein